MSWQFLHVSLLACSQSQQHGPQQMLLRSVYATYTSHQKHRKPVPFLPIRYACCSSESEGPGSQERKGWGRKSQCMLRKLLRCLTGWLHCLSGTPSTLKSVYSLRSARPSPSCETNCTFSFINFFLSGVFTLDSWGNVTMHSPLFNRQTLGN